MNKPTTKKTTKNLTIKKTTLKPVEKTTTYKVTMYFNNTENVYETNDPTEVILSAKPFLLKTKVIIKIEKDGKTAEKVFQPVIARRLWKLPTSFKAIITRLIYK